MSPLSFLVAEESSSNETLTPQPFPSGRQHVPPLPLRTLSKSQKPKKKKRTQQIAFRYRKFPCGLGPREQTSLSSAFRGFLVWPQKPLEMLHEPPQTEARSAHSNLTEGREQMMCTLFQATCTFSLLKG